MDPPHTQSTPTVSCVIPCYNAATTLGRSVRSVLAQDGLQECVLVDDGSTDATQAVARTYEDADPRVRLVGLSRNSGQAAARNAGAAFTTGDLLVFLDADDEYLPGFFAAAGGWFGRHPDRAGLKTGIEFADLPADLSLADDDPRYEAAIYSSASNLVLRRSVFWAAGGFPVGPAFRGKLGGEDIALNNALQGNYGLAYLPRKFLRVYNRPGSHLELYLRRTDVVNGQVVFHTQLPEEQDGSWHAALQRYQRQAASNRQHLALLLGKQRGGG